MERNEASPQFYKLPSTRVGLEAHVDDFHGVGRKSEVEALLPKLREALKLKASDEIITGTYEHLKRLRIKVPEGLFLLAHAKHARNIIKTLGLEGANCVRTPDLAEDPPEHSP